MAETSTTNTSATCSKSSRSESNQATANGAPDGLNPEASSSVDRFKLMYPAVNETETPLPRRWSRLDKHLSMRLSSNKLRVHLKGTSKLYNDAVSVRASHPIPTTCGIYYFEVKIISIGQQGKIGIGLTSPLSLMNCLPGSSIQSYGLHGDTGHVHSSSSPGFEYGPTFNTNDIVGCCFDMVNNTLSFTMNGEELGIAVRTLPTNLFPTVGLQSQGAEIEANFGKKPFKFSKIVTIMDQMRSEIKSSIHNFPLSWAEGNSTIQKLVCSYLVHHGYSATAEAFSKATEQKVQENMTSIRMRQMISNLIMAGHVGEAIETTISFYPGLLESNKNILFMLKCREFIEYSIKVAELVPENSNNKNSTETVTERTTTEATTTAKTIRETTTTTTTESTTTTAKTITAPNNDQNIGPVTVINTKTDEETQSNSVEDNLDSGDGPSRPKRICPSENVDTANNSNDSRSEDAKVPASPILPKQPLEHLLALCKELSNMGEQLDKENKLSTEERQLMQDACSSLAYTDPWASPLGSQLCPSRRADVCRALNSAILASLNNDKMPPLESCIAHASELLKVMSLGGMGAIAYANINEVFSKK